MSIKVETIKSLKRFFNIFFWCAPFGCLYFSTMNQNWVQEWILAWFWTHFNLVYWMRQDSNPQPFDRESSLLTTKPDWRPSRLNFTYTRIADHGRSDWLGYWVEFVQKASFKKLACLCHIKQNDLTYLGRVCTPCLSVSTGIYARIDTPEMKG